MLLQDPKADTTIFSSNLSILISRKEVTEEKICTDLDAQLPRLQSWLKGHCFPKYSMMVKICNYFEYYDIYKLITQPIQVVSTA